VAKAERKRPGRANNPLKDLKLPELFYFKDLFLICVEISTVNEFEIKCPPRYMRVLGGNFFEEKYEENGLSSRQISRIFEYFDIHKKVHHCNILTSCYADKDG